MKPRNIALAGIILALTSSVNAAPMYYIFDGVLDNINDSAGFAAEQNVTLGSTFRTVFLVDMLEAGTTTSVSMYPIYNQVYSQELIDRSYVTTGIEKDYFFADLVSQQLLHGDAWTDLGTIEENYGLNTTEKYLNDKFQLNGSNSINTTGAITHLSAYYQDFSEITIGKEFSYEEVAATGGGSEAYLRTTLYGTATLVNITDTYVTPVPVPAAIWLFGSGLIGLVGFARRKKA